MKKRIHVFENGKQALIMGDLDIRSVTDKVVAEYEVKISDKKFEKMMKEPDKIKIDKIKEKKKIKQMIR